jgi:hypothetical protein
MPSCPKPLPDAVLADLSSPMAVFYSLHEDSIGTLYFSILSGPTLDWEMR